MVTSMCLITGLDDQLKQPSTHGEFVFMVILSAQWIEFEVSVE